MRELVIEFKILVTYFSQTGNTEKIAQSICDGCEGEEVEIKPIKDVNPSMLNEYELVFLGSGIYASRVNKSLSDLIKAATRLPSKLVFFCTHASLDSYQDGFKVVKRNIKDTEVEIVGSWDCMGENLGIPESTRQAMLKRLPPEQRKQAEAHQENLKSHPNKEDLENAKEFAQSLIQKL
jgi:flavodoxin